MFSLGGLHLLEAGKLDSLLLSVPVPSFSSAARPPLRTFRRPLGLTSSPRVLRENRVMLRALLLFRLARELGLPCMCLQPGNSVAVALQPWTVLASKPGVVQLKVPKVCSSKAEGSLWLACSGRSCSNPLVWTSGSPLLLPALAQVPLCASS